MSKPFIHLHTHSNYSLLDGLNRIPDLVKTAKKNGMHAMALTDHGNMYGTIEFYKECKKQGIKPIIGVEGYLATRSRFDKDPGLDNKRFHITLLAKNLQGYKNLMRLVTLSNLEGFYYKPRMDKAILKEFHEGIICLSGCPAGELARAIVKDDMKKARALIEEYQDIFGKENYFLEIMHHPEVPGIDKLRKVIVELSEEYKIPLVGTQDSHYLHFEDQEAHETLLRINTQGDKNGKGMSMKDGNYSFIDTDQANTAFSDIKFVVENTNIVADCIEDYEIELGVPYFPNYEIANGNTPDEELREKVFEGLKEKELPEDEINLKRIEYELGIIKQKGYPAYFLIVADLYKFARENDILANTRGSAAGSFVSYLIGISNINPIEFKLPFERFLNPERPSLPDIDMDYADNRRQEVIEYTKKKYGEDRVAQIGTFGKMMAKGAVRDVARALGYPYATGDRLSVMIPEGSQGFPMTIDKAMEINVDLKRAYEEEADTKKIIDLAKKVEGGVRHVSVHAAGIVIAPKPLYEFTPTQFDPKGGGIITQYDMHNIEEAGLPKFDFLGIRNLSILGESIRLVKLLRNIVVDINKIPFDDVDTYKMLARGETVGVFQLSGDGMTKYLKDLKPNRLEDLFAMVALYRPGPMAFIPDYIKRKENPNLVKYIDKRLKDILSDTYGILIYQDDILIIAVNIAGYSWGDADKFRKAMGKKIPEEMEKQHGKFIDGCIKNGMDAGVAKQLWEMIETFAAYGFNKGHAASYGRLSYQTAYMKEKYTVEYMCAIMTSESGDIDKISEAIAEAKRLEIKVLPPDINESFEMFTVIDNNKKSGIIRFGLHTIKGLGSDIAHAIIEEREKNGKYKNLTDFLKRITHKNLNKKSLEALIKSGAMDFFGNRGQMFYSIEELCEYNRRQKESNTSQVSLFGGISDYNDDLILRDQEELDEQQRLFWEKDLLGLYITGHPLDEYRERIESKGVQIKAIKESFGVDKEVIIAGMITAIRVVATKKGEQMAFMTIEDFNDKIDCVVFPKIYQEKKEFILEDKIVALQGKVSIKDGEKSIIVNNIKVL